MPVPLVRTSSRPRIGFALLVGMIALFAAAKAIVYDTLDPDCFWHLRVGEQLLRDGVRPLTDSLAFASIREPWVPYSWLAEIGMLKLWQAGGLRAVVGITALMQAMLVVFTAMACRELVAARCTGTGRNPDRRWLAATLGVAFATFLSLPYLSFRPVTFAIVLLSCVAWLLLRDRRFQERSKSVWGIVPVTVLLANVHFFAFLVPVWVAALLAGAMWERWCRFDNSDLPELRRCVNRYALLLILTLAATAATPLLPGVIRSMLHYTLADPMVRSTVISEMQPFYAGSMGKISLVLVLALSACVWMKQHRIRAGELAWLLIGTALLLKLGRFSPIFAILAGPVLALTLPELSDRLLAKPLVQLAVAVVLVMGTVRVAGEFPSSRAQMGAWVNRLGPDAPGYPTDAANYIAAHIPALTGRLVNEFGWGGYLEWRLGDRFQVLVDGRTQLFTPRFWEQTYLNGEGARRAFLETVRADAAVVPVNRSLFRPALLALGWRSVHRDDRAEVLVPPHASLVNIEP